MSIFLGNTPLTNTGYDKANTDLSNLTSIGKNIANWSNNVTNCITEIPQDIKLELVDGTLTLKAGSKVYVPNGAEIFNSIITTSDIQLANPSANVAQFILYVENNGTKLWVIETYYTESGSSSTLTTHWRFWYDTVNNIIKRTDDEGSTWSTGYSFPIALITHNGSQWVSIDQVFNGFGFIGSTIFALPGVKGLIPNGRNADGSLKNIEFTTSKVLTVTTTSLTFNIAIPFVILDTCRLAYNGAYRFDDENNVVYDGSSVIKQVVCGFVTLNKSVITSFTPKTAFHAVDYNDVDNRIIDIMNSIYPVGSFYFSTASTCPLQDLGIGTWQNVGTSLTLSVNTNVPVKGNGMVIGFTNGTINAGGLQIYGDTGGNRNMIQQRLYGTSVTNTAIAGTNIGNGVYGITTDSSKSGIVGTITRTQITVNVFQRIS